MIKPNQKRENFRTASKQESELSQSSMSFSSCQPSGEAEESKLRRGMGLIDCLMTSQSTEIQQLNSHIRLLTSRNHYLQKDNQLLQNQIAFLNERISQLTAQHEANPQSFMDFIPTIREEFTRFEAMLANRLELLVQRELKVEQMVHAVRDKLTKYKAQRSASPADHSKMLRLEMENTKLSVRVAQLSKNIEEMGIKYIQGFEWRPYLIPQFKQQVANSAATNKEDLKIDLKFITQPPTTHKISIYA